MTNSKTGKILSEPFKKALESLNFKQLSSWKQQGRVTVTTTAYECTSELGGSTSVSFQPAYERLLNDGKLEQFVQLLDLFPTSLNLHGSVMWPSQYVEARADLMTKLVCNKQLDKIQWLFTGDVPSSQDEVRNVLNISSATIRFAATTNFRAFLQWYFARPEIISAILEDSEEIAEALREALAGAVESRQSEMLEWLVVKSGLPMNLNAVIHQDFLCEFASNWDFQSIKQLFMYAAAAERACVNPPKLLRKSLYRTLIRESLVSVSQVRCAADFTAFLELFSAHLQPAEISKLLFRIFNNTAECIAFLESEAGIQLLFHALNDTRNFPFLFETLGNAAPEKLRPALQKQFQLALETRASEIQKLECALQKQLDDATTVYQQVIAKSLPTDVSAAPTATLRSLQLVTQASFKKRLTAIRRVLELEQQAQLAALDKQLVSELQKKFRSFLIAGKRPNSALKNRG